jgi:hypothetical protein
MPSLNQSQIDILLTDLWGARLDRATATLPQSAAAAIFTVSAGRVVVNMLIGQVTTIIQAQACNVKLKVVPTAGSTVDLCAVVDINALEVGGKLVVPGVAATALTKANAGAIIVTSTGFICDPGTIQLDCSASNTGSIKWSILWHPLDDGALIVTA